MFFSSLMFWLIIPVCFMKFILNLNHLLNSLLTLEFISLSFLLGFSGVMCAYDFNNMFLLYFLVMVVCEGVLGLSFLILMSFNFGSDYLFSFNSLSC
uniref:NADH dehydrogenase subunit 4L n=1 Tax=Grandidierella taihuensis TaxID=2778875 RepID=UPI001BED644C|nr:NADH dehydrogenase subunit 4L [Grandidierella taihuensis]QTX95231.1 NADH dehydrogenase subunit 4L [Grandidierella taihuensis]